jgi:hypothetical protein
MECLWKVSDSFFYTCDKFSHKGHCAVGLGYILACNRKSNVGDPRIVLAGVSLDCTDDLPIGENMSSTWGSVCRLVQGYPVLARSSMNRLESLNVRKRTFWCPPLSRYISSIGRAPT